MKKRILLTRLFHETHTFLDEVTGLDEFSIRKGEELLASHGDGSPLDGFLEIAAREDWEVVPTIDVCTSPSGTVDDAVLDFFWREFEQRASAAIEKGLDGAYFVLHGAMATDKVRDVEGEVLARFRALPGAADLPVFGVLDLHANSTEKMARNSNCLVAYRKNPHTDAREASTCSALLLKRCLDTGVLPNTFWMRPPVMAAPTGTGTDDEPMCSLEQTARDLENANESTLSVNVLAGYSFADTPDTGFSFTVVTEGSESEARQQLEQIVSQCWNLRKSAAMTERDIDEVLEEILPIEEGPVVLVEPAENIGGGAPGDGTGILRAFLQHRVEDALLAINDPEAVVQAHNSALGSKLNLSIGGKGSRFDPGPVELEVELVSTSDGKFELEDIHSHLASMVGKYVDMGPSAVVRHKGILILLTSYKTAPFDLGQYTSQGINPSAMKLIGVKAAVAHRQAYNPIARQQIWVDTPGPCPSNLHHLPFKYIKRPVYPLDDFEYESG